jgi:glycerate kinase
MCGFEEKLAGASLVLTGEGKTDGQTASGNAVLGVARLARKHAVPVVVLAGSVEKGLDRLYAGGVTSVFSICNGPMTLEHAIEDAEAVSDTPAGVRFRLNNCLKGLS